MEVQQKKGSRFIVDLGGVKLPDVVEKRVEAEIRAVVLRVLASTDFRGSNFRLQQPFTDWATENLPQGTSGMVLVPPEDESDNDSEDESDNDSN